MEGEKWLLRFTSYNHICTLPHLVHAHTCAHTHTHTETINKLILNALLATLWDSAALFPLVVRGDLSPARCLLPPTQEKRWTDLLTSPTRLTSSTRCLIFFLAPKYLPNELMPTSSPCCAQLLYQPEGNCFINSEVLHRCRGWLISRKVFIEHQPALPLWYIFLVAYNVCIDAWCSGLWLWLS